MRTPASAAPTSKIVLSHPAPRTLTPSGSVCAPNVPSGNTTTAPAFAPFSAASTPPASRTTISSAPHHEPVNNINAKQPTTKFNDRTIPHTPIKAKSTNRPPIRRPPKNVVRSPWNGHDDRVQYRRVNISPSTDRSPFDLSTSFECRKITTIFAVETEQEADGSWIAEVPELPGVMAYGTSPDDAVRRVQALSLRVLAERLENNESIPQFQAVFSIVA